MRNKNKLLISSLISKYLMKSKNGRFVLTYHSLNSILNNLTTDIYQLDPKTFSEQMLY